MPTHIVRFWPSGRAFRMPSGCNMWPCEYRRRLPGPGSLVPAFGSGRFWARVSPSWLADYRDEVRRERYPRAAGGAVKAPGTASVAAAAWGVIIASSLTGGAAEKGMSRKCATAAGLRPSAAVVRRAIKCGYRMAGARIRRVR